MCKQQALHPLCFCFHHKPVSSLPPGSATCNSAFYTKYQLMVRTEDMSTWVAITGRPDFDSWDRGIKEASGEEMGRGRRRGV
ncbi:hypothetical protein CRENBAI_013041 [Crenichthys baileyi]|uniref:Uncharacterized protein n=1 Tax=Crenichthys baileyi TaxID=28760 RepID=A0AAV9SR20_9TELE